MLCSLGIASSNKVETLSPSLIHIKFILNSYRFSNLLWLIKLTLTFPEQWPWRPMAHLWPYGTSPTTDVVSICGCSGDNFWKSILPRSRNGNPWQPRTSTWQKTWLVKGWRSSKGWPAPNVLEDGGPWRTMEDQSCDLQRPCHDSTSGARPINVSPSCRPNKHNTTRPRYKWGWSERHTLAVMDPWTVLHSLRDVGQIWEVVFPCNIPYLDLNSHNITSQRLYSEVFCMCCDIHFGLCLHWCTWTSIYIIIVLFIVICYKLL